MKYPYMVNKNGVYYPAGTEVPEGKSGENTYTKTSINRMAVAELKALASEQEIDGVEDKTGEELKKILIEKLEL